MCSHAPQAAATVNSNLSQAGVVSRLFSSKIPVLSSVIRSTAAAASLRRTASISSTQGSEYSRLSFTTTDSSPPSSRPSTPSSTPLEPSDLARIAGCLPPLSQGQCPDSCGINWPLVQLSSQLLSSATNVAQQPNADPAVVRSLHLDATRYLMLSLPANLSSHETALVRATIPREVMATATTACNELARLDMPPPRPAKMRSNALRLGVANLTGYLMALLFFLIPLFVTCVNRLLMYERHYQLSERALAYSLKLGKDLAERGSEIPAAYQKFREGPVGHALVASGSWLAEGIAGGIFDGMQNAQHYHFQAQMNDDKQLVTIP